jgi:hypothetical protein
MGSLSQLWRHRVFYNKSILEHTNGLQYLSPLQGHNCNVNFLQDTKPKIYYNVWAEVRHRHCSIQSSSVTFRFTCGKFRYWNFQIWTELRFLAPPFSIKVTFIELFAPLIMQLTLIKLFFFFIWQFEDLVYAQQATYLPMPASVPVQK